MKPLKKPILYTLFLALIACTGPGVNISAPTDGSTVTSPVRVVANAVGSSDTAPITTMTVSVDGTQVGATINGGSVDESIPMAQGAHTITVAATDSSGKNFSAQSNVTVSGTTTPLPTGLVPAVGHVYVLVEENQSSSVLTDGSMPYLSSLATTYAQAVNYYAVAHPSIGNYFMMTAGQIYTPDDNFNSTVDIDNIARQMIANGKTWKSYAESIPSVGYTGGPTGNYLRRHNPLSFYSDVVNSPTQVQNLVGLPQFLSDFQASTFPNYSFIVPNVNDDAHNGTPQEADAWLQKYIEPLIESPQFQNDGLLIITFDEGSELDNTGGGGHIPFILVSAKAKKGFQAQGFYQHENLLKMTCAAMRLPSCPGSAVTANDMSEFFQ